MIGIAMTTYNVERFLREQIDSILNQTYTDFELIICDDVSSDSTVDILNEYAQKDSRIHIIQNEKNLGFLKNFEKAIRICLERGAEYIALSDQDDIWLPNHLEVLLKTLNGKEGLACGDVRLIDENNKEYSKLSERLNFNMEKLSVLDKLKSSLYSLNLFQGGCMLIHKSCFNFLFPLPNNIYVHDTWFFLCSAYYNRFYYNSECLSKYRQHLNNTSGDKIHQPLFNKHKFQLFFKRQALSDRFYYVQGLIERFNPSDIQIDHYSEIKKAYSFFLYKKWFLYRFFHLSFYIKRYKFFTQNKPFWYSILKYILYG